MNSSRSAVVFHQEVLFLVLRYALMSSVKRASSRKGVKKHVGPVPKAPVEWVGINQPSLHPRSCFFFLCDIVEHPSAEQKRCVSLPIQPRQNWFMFLIFNKGMDLPDAWRSTDGRQPWASPPPTPLAAAATPPPNEPPGERGKRRN